MNNLAARLITALIGVGILLAAILYDQITFLIVFLLISLFSIYEFYQIGKNSGKRPFVVWGMLVTAVLFCLTYLLKVGNEVYTNALLGALIALIPSLFILAVFRKNKEDIVNCMSYSALGVFYIAIPLSLLNFIAFNQGEYRFDLIIALLFSLWANDTGAYFAGKALGKHKLYESISPNKTIEGTVGGLVLSLLIAVGLSFLGFDLTIAQLLGLAAIVSIFGSIGDLAESLLKRNLAIKDSGSILPGHGGFLDRFDGLFLALPFATLYIHLVI